VSSLGTVSQSRPHPRPHHFCNILTRNLLRRVTGEDPPCRWLDSYLHCIGIRRSSEFSDQTVKSRERTRGDAFYLLTPLQRAKTWPNFDWQRTRLTGWNVVIIQVRGIRRLRWADTTKGLLFLLIVFFAFFCAFIFLSFDGVRSGVCSVTKAFPFCAHPVQMVLHPIHPGALIWLIRIICLPGSKCYSTSFLLSRRIAVWQVNIWTCDAYR
jgi:hypothetical protein